MNIEVWFGDGDYNPIGPIEAELVSDLGNGEAEIRITDKGWLNHVGFDEPWEYTCKRLPANHFVCYDDYAWCPVGEGGAGNPWWRGSSETT